MTNIPVTWDPNLCAPTAPNITVKGKSAQTIVWIPEKGLTITAITTPQDPKQPHCKDFSCPEPVGGSKNWKCTDALDNNGCFLYDIEGTFEGVTAKMDPQIVNERNPG